MFLGERGTGGWEGAGESATVSSRQGCVMAIQSPTSSKGHSPVGCVVPLQLKQEKLIVKRPVPMRGVSKTVRRAPSMSEGKVWSSSVEAGRG